MYQRILVPVDGSHTSTLGLQEAIRIAIDQRARLRIIHVVDELVVAQNFDGYFNTGDLLDALRDAGKKAIQNALALTRKHDLKAESALFESLGGRISEVIVKEAKKWRADLIVMGTHGRRGVTRMVLGSDAEAILRTTPVPVLLVRSPDRKQRRG
ncbi:MAG: universal stress protein [Betaproteobacteria bacterium]|nr:MAG: universal stress protein [Betaproteobacteria bacterium]